jgi:hypothetical protein
MNKVDDPKVAAAIAEERWRNEEAVERHPVVLQEEWLKATLRKGNLVSKLPSSTFDPHS